MQLIYQNPHSLFARLHPNGDGARADESPARRRFVPAIDIHEEDTRFLVTADLPGVAVDGLDITVDAGLLTIRGERELPAAANGAELRRAERAAGRFERSFRLPETAADEGIEASYRQGVLTVSIPKTRAAMPYRIEVTQH